MRKGSDRDELNAGVVSFLARTQPNAVSNEIDVRIRDQTCYLHGSMFDVGLRERWESFREVPDWGEAEEEERYVKPERGDPDRRNR